MSEAWIQYVLASYRSSPVCAWQQQLLIPNCSTLTWWEADLLAVSRAGYCTEVEIKCSMSDWRVDQHKGKHGHEDEEIIKKFYYAGPMKLMRRYDEVWTKTGSGIIGISEEPSSWGGVKIEVLRAAIAKPALKLTERQVQKLGRTMHIRYWTWAAKANAGDFFKSPAMKAIEAEQALGEQE